jgi:hypothetical protein
MGYLAKYPYTIICPQPDLQLLRAAAGGLSLITSRKAGGNPIPLAPFVRTPSTERQLLRRFCSFLADILERFYCHARLTAVAAST